MRTATRSDYRDRILLVVSHLAEHLDDTPDLAELAGVGGFSPFWFHRVFSNVVGETPADISRRMRLERAAWNLRTTDRTLADLALQAGFSDQAAFTKAFRNAYGATPGRFRSEKMSAHELPGLAEIHFRPQGRPYRIWLPKLEEITMKIEYQNLEPQRYAYLRHHGPYHEIGSTFGKMCEITGPAGLASIPGTYFVGVYHNDPGATPPEELESDAGVTLLGDTPVPDGLEEGTLPGGRYAKGVHIGSYSKMGESWGELWSAIHAAGDTPRASSPFEVYISDMEKTPENELLTDLYVAVE